MFSVPKIMFRDSPFQNPCTRLLKCHKTLLTLLPVHEYKKIENHRFKDQHEQLGMSMIQLRPCGYHRIDFIKGGQTNL